VFVDTPGVGSQIEAETEDRYAFLPECDAVLFLTSADPPFTCSEQQYLHAIHRYANTIFFVLNKTDSLHNEEEMRSSRGTS